MVETIGLEPFARRAPVRQLVTTCWNNKKMVETIGLEPTTSAMRMLRSTR